MFLYQANTVDGAAKVMVQLPLSVLQMLLQQTGRTLQLLDPTSEQVSASIEPQLGVIYVTSFYCFDGEPLLSCVFLVNSG